MHDKLATTILSKDLTENRPPVARSFLKFSSRSFPSITHNSLCGSFQLTADFQESPHRTHSKEISAWLLQPLRINDVGHNTNLAFPQTKFTATRWLIHRQHNKKEPLNSLNELACLQLDTRMRQAELTNCSSAVFIPKTLATAFDSLLCNCG